MKFLCKNSKEQAAFEKWAFGYTPVNYATHTHALRHNWNSKYGNLLLIQPTDSVSDNLNKMREIWKEKMKEINS